MMQKHKEMKKEKRIALEYRWHVPNLCLRH